MRPASRDEIERLRKAFAEMRTATARYQLAIEEVRQACCALPSHTVLDDETGTWEPQPQQGGPRIVTAPAPTPITAPAPMPTAACAARRKHKGRH